MKRKLNIQTQFFLSYLCIAVVVVGIFSFIFYRYVSNILIQRETNTFQNTAKTLLDQTDSEIQVMDSVSVNMTYSNLAKDRISEYFNLENGNQYDFSSLVELFVAINGSDYHVYAMNLYSNDGQQIRVASTTTSTQVDLDELDWVKPTAALNGYKYISLPYSTSSMLRTSKVSPYYISLYRTLRGRSGHQIGYVEVIQQTKKIFEHITSFLRTSDNSILVYVFNEGGDLIYPYDIDQTKDQSLYEYYFILSQNTDKNNTTLNNPKTDGRELVISKASTYSNWTYVCVQKESAILAPVKSFTKILVLIVAFFLLFVISLSYIMAVKLTSPLYQLITMIHKTKLDTLGSIDSDSLDTTFNEFDKLNEAFQQMSSNLKTSMDELIETRQQEMKSRSLALQSQMNPHFYYNSLSSIIVLAENEQSQDVVNLCKNLSNIMRYITKGTALEVSLGEEIEYISKYLYCMKVRYQSSLNYSIQIDPTLFDLKVPKLIIQPLVENTLKYGTNCYPPWFIKIESEVNEKFWAIHVSDSGNGFTAETLLLIKERMKQADASIGMPETQIDGMGMINVYSRWKLFCGNDYIFEFGNKDNGGSFVTIGKRIS
jgi:two-component system, sensor histidine kinase YesM